MSDDTPTERFEPPTARLPHTGASTGDSTGAVPGDAGLEPSGEGRNRGMLIALIAVAAAILIALIVLIVVVVGNAGPAGDQPAPEASATESESPTPTPTPEETESAEPSSAPSATAAPPPAPQSPSFATFTGPDRATCPDTSSAVAITWSWSSTNAVNAWFGIGTTNAKAEPFESVATTATYTFNYQCSQPSQIYTVTLEDSAGRLTHKTVEIVRQ